jgi:chromosome segregation ATPase
MAQYAPDASAIEETKMRNDLAATLCLIAVLGLVLVSHAQTTGDETTIQEVKQETQDLIGALKGYGADQRDEAVKKTKQALEELDGRIDTLETRIDNHWDQMDKAAREKARASLRALHKQRIQLAEWYGAWKESSASAWEHMKSGFADAYEALSEAWERAEMEFGAK